MSCPYLIAPSNGTNGVAGSFATLWPKACLESKSARHTDLTVTHTVVLITPRYLVCSSQKKHKVHVSAPVTAPLSPSAEPGWSWGASLGVLRQPELLTQLQS